MNHLDLTLASAEENLALDEALLDGCDADSGGEVLRFWSPRETFVVLGYANRIDLEVRAAVCRQRSVPILRRCTGGGTVVQAPGCLNYSLVLRLDGPAPLESITSTNRHVMGRNQSVFESLLQTEVRVQGATDLTVGPRKFSGNAQRRKRQSLLFHGTILLEMDFQAVEDLLPLPSRQPEYRAGRKHSDFLLNLHLPPSVVKQAFATVWGATGATTEVPWERVRQLMTERYGRDEWHRKW